MSNSLRELLTLGFEHVENFSLVARELTFVLTKHKTGTGCYAFVVDQLVPYIGVTQKKLYVRMNGYKNPGPTQGTNKRINTKIREASKVEIYFLPESEMM